VVAENWRSGFLKNWGSEVQLRDGHLAKLKGSSRHIRDVRISKNADNLNAVLFNDVVLNLHGFFSLLTLPRC